MISKNELSKLKKLEDSILPDEILKVYIQNNDGDGFRDNDGKTWTAAELEHERNNNTRIKQILVVKASSHRNEAING